MRKIIGYCGIAFMGYGCTAGNADNRPGAAPYPLPDMNSWKARAVTAKQYCRSHRMDTGVCLLADMHLHSGLKRLVVWDMNKDTILFAGLVSHGCGRGPWGKDRSKTAPLFSNDADSHCSAPGKYAIGARGRSQWGIRIKYLLHGLEATNSNALKREIVLHGWDAIADEATYPEGSPEGWGCPAVYNNMMRELDSLLQRRQRQVLLWVYQ